MINYVTVPEFDKDFKTLSKKFRTLEKDFGHMKKYTIETFYEKGVPTTAFVPIEGFCGENYTSNKMRKFSCQSLKGRGSASGIRVIFIWEEETRKITFIEIYFKADQANENKERLQKFIKENFGHKDGVVKKIGLCRYDSIKNNAKKQILIMPTWRYFLRNLSDTEFVKSDYYKNFYEILTDENLNSALSKHGYEIILYLHYELQKFSHLFKTDLQNVKIADFKSYGVRELLTNSSLLVTDYSSVFFDFAYMRKPILYFWFDEEKFFATQYDKGYFDCRKDGFGRVVKTKDEVVNFLINKLENGMKNDEVYSERADKFFGEEISCRCERRGQKSSDRQRERQKDFRVWSIHESCLGGIKNCAGQCDRGSDGENCRIGGSHEEKRKGTAWLY